MLHIYVIKYIFSFFVFFQFSPPPSLNLYRRASIVQSPPPHLHHAHHATTAHQNPTGTKTHIKKKKKKKPSERQNLEEPTNHVVTHADLHQTHHRDPRQSHHDLAGHKHWQSPTTNNPLQPQPNHDPNTILLPTSTSHIIVDHFFLWVTIRRVLWLVFFFFFLAVGHGDRRSKIGVG